MVQDIVGCRKSPAWNIDKFIVFVDEWAKDREEELMAMEDRMDRRLQEHSDKIHKLQNKVDFFVRTSLPPVEGIFYGGQIFDATICYPA